MTKLYEKRDAFDFHIVNFPLCQAIFHQHQPMVSMHLSSFAMPIVARRRKQNLHPWVKVDQAIRPLPPKTLSIFVG